MELTMFRKLIRETFIADYLRYGRELSYLVRTPVITKRGFRFIGIQRMMQDDFEPDICALIENEASRGANLFIDVGAHHGYFSVLASFLGMKVQAFEPDPVNFKVLTRNLRLNGFSHVEIFNFGVADFENIMTFYGFSTGVSTKNHWGGNVSKRKFTAKVVKLDEFIDFTSSLDSRIILKVDVEGFEDRVLKGAQKLLSESKNCLLIVEVSFREDQGTSGGIKDEASKLFGFLCSHGYLPHSISQSGKLELLEEIEVEHLLEFGKTISGNYAFKRA